MNFHIFVLTEYMTVVKLWTLLLNKSLLPFNTFLDHMENKQPHYFFIILGEDSWGILIVIPCERLIIGNCITAKVKPDHFMILLCCQLQRPTRTH